ncbi:hypothetical protein [Microvirga sp. TS319]|uniref:hypothetical protein n=1 Tax=Microvirga sp. TS319 TaxID=3241165 RepID=UPI00351A58AB
MSKDERDKLFNGKKDENGKTVDLGVISIRGLKAAEAVKATMERPQHVGNNRNQ